MSDRSSDQSKAKTNVPAADDDDDEPTIKDSIQKVIWIVTYCPAGKYITREMLRDIGGIQADECHSTTDGTMNYTYIHLVKRCRAPCIERFFSKAKKQYGITNNAVFGYTAIYSIKLSKDDESITQHVGFNMLTRHYKEKHPMLSLCTDGKEELTRGMLYEAIHGSTAKKSRPNHKRKAAQAAIDLEQAAKKNSQLSLENSMLRERIKTLEAALDEMRNPR